MKKISTLFLALMAMFATSLWAEDFTIASITNGSNVAPANLVKVTLGGNAAASSGRIDVGSSKTGTITMTTTVAGLYLKSATITDTQYSGSKKGTLTCTGGTITPDANGVYTFTASENTTTATITIAASSSGTCKLSTFSIVVTNGELNDIVTLATNFSMSESTITSANVTCNGNTVSAPITLTSSDGWAVSSNKISAPNSNAKHITVTAADGKYLKFVAFYDDANARLALTESSSTGGTVDGASWTAANNSTTSVTFYQYVGTSLTVAKVFVITGDMCYEPSITTQPTNAAVMAGGANPTLSVVATHTTAYAWKESSDGTSYDGASTLATTYSFTPDVSGSVQTKYYYCELVNNCDLSNIIKTNIVTVTVSAATAPSFTSVTPSAANVVRGTASNIVAVVAGTPTPTIQWYSNTTASNEGGEAIDGATELTLDLENTAVGTYYYYAVATNASGSVASAVQTISVKPQAPVLPSASVPFINSTSVEISKADGEAGAAVIEYSTDGEHWNEYSTALELSATTTVRAKVVQGGLESSISEETYTKFAKSDLVSISGSKTWTIPTTISLELTNSTTPSKYDEYYTYADIASLNGNDLGEFDGTTLAFSGQYPYRSSYGSQNGNLKFITTVPGTLTVQFSNTSGSNSGRWVKVNDTKGSVEASGTTKRNEDFTISAGTVIITHVDSEGALSPGIRVYSLNFVKSEETALDNTADEVKAIKRIENGMLIIEKNGIRYNAQGQVIR